MAKEIKGKLVKKNKHDVIFPLEKKNFIILGVGLLVIILGYVALSGNRVEGFLPLTLAPILLILGYCVIIPIGILYRKKEETPSDKTSEVTPQ
jgi:hypothetical protein